MATVQLIVKEIFHRKLNFLFSLLGIISAVALFVSFFTSGEASKRETTRLMRDIGFNVRIIPGKTDMQKFWANGFSEHTMPETYALDLASHESFAYNHLTATLQKKISWRGMDIMVTGIAPEVAPPGFAKQPMAFTIKPGTAYVGFEIANSLGLKQGDTIDLPGRQLAITRCLQESGSDDDIRIYGSLQDIQNILNLPGKINEIKALQCLCIVNGKNITTLDTLKEHIGRVLPDTKTILIQSIAAARENQRLMMENYFAFILPVIMIACMAWIGVLAMLNVRERRQEIGIMRAVGYGSAKIAFLFLGKAVIIGLLGAVAGYAAGTGLALVFGPEIFKVTAAQIKPEIGLLYWSIAVSPLFVALSAFIPAMLAVVQDPAQTLREV